MSTANRKTPDQTFPFSGGNNSTFQRKNSNRSNSTCSNFSLDQNIEISNQTLTPTLLCLKQQNQHLSNQKQSMQKDMKTLETLTQSLLLENQALRMHFHQRSSDIKQLIQSFCLNVDQNLSQCRHLVHSYQGHNGILAKNIQMLNGKIQEVQEVISKVRKQFDEVSSFNNKLDEFHRNIKVKSKMFDKNIKNLQKKVKENKCQQLQKEICELQVNNNLMKKKNLTTLKFIKGEKYAISNQKPALKQKAVEAIKTVKMLQDEVLVMQFDLKQYTSDKTQLNLKLSSIQQLTNNSYSQRQSKQSKVKRSQQLLQRLKQKTGQILSSTKVLESTKVGLQKEKQRLQKLVKEKRQKNEQAEKQHEKTKLKIKNQAIKKIRDIQQQLNGVKKNVQRSMFEEFNPEEKQYESLIVSHRTQVRNLEQEIQKMKDKVQETHNPVKDIIRIEMELKKIKNKW